MLSALSPSVWPWLVLATLVQFVVLFLWDTVSLWWLFSLPDRPLPFRPVLRERVDASLWTAVNVHLGQGIFAWKMARMARISVADALGRATALVVFDSIILLTLGLVGSFWLYAQRLILFLFTLAYAGFCLAICRFPVDARTVLSVIPLVLIAEGLPSTGGLGQREVALVYLLQPQTAEQRAVLLSFGLIWSVVVILGRLMVGLVGHWLHHPGDES